MAAALHKSSLTRQVSQWRDVAHGPLVCLTNVSVWLYSLNVWHVRDVAHGPLVTTCTCMSKKRLNGFILSIKILVVKFIKVKENDFATYSIKILRSCSAMLASIPLTFQQFYLAVSLFVSSTTGPNSPKRGTSILWVEARTYIYIVSILCIGPKWLDGRSMQHFFSLKIYE